MVDHYSDVTYVHVTRRTIQEEILSRKKPLNVGLPRLELKYIGIMHKMK